MDKDSIGITASNALNIFKSELDNPSAMESKEVNNLEKLIALMPLYAPKEYLDGYAELSKALIKSDNSILFGIGYAIYHRLSIRDINTDGLWPDMSSSLSDFQNFYYASALLEGGFYAIPNKLDVYENYIKYMAEGVSDGTFPMDMYNNAMLLRKDIEKQSNTEKENAKNIFGVFMRKDSKKQDD